MLPTRPLPAALYESDFYAWTLEQAAVLRRAVADQRDAATEIDFAHIAEELEDMGRSAKRELVNRLGVLLAHLLKWQFQVPFRSGSWVGTIREQRHRIGRHLRDNPSLKACLDEAVTDAYEDAIVAASTETGLDEGVLPAACPYTFAQMMDGEFWPGAS